MNPKQLERILDDQLEQYTLEEFLEQFDITPLEIFTLAYETGLVDDDILESLIPSDGE